MVVTPMGVAVEEQVVAVTVPSIDGEMGILPGHTQYAGLVGTGVLSFQKSENSPSERMMVSGGFCQFGNSSLTILADMCVSAEAIDRQHYAANRAELQKIIDTEDSNSQAWISAKEKLSRIEAIDAL